ncbi:unnamed protein product [Pedinophyceae sp. YPF-701]|nr:unnamed protein product [Pedinophyceae sp. YPF-701]
MAPARQCHSEHASVVTSPTSGSVSPLALPSKQAVSRSVTAAAPPATCKSLAPPQKMTQVSTMKVGECSGGVIKVSAHPHGVLVAHLDLLYDVYREVQSCVRNPLQVGISRAAIQRCMRRQEEDEHEGSSEGHAGADVESQERRKEQAREILTLLDQHVQRMKPDVDGRHDVVFEDLIGVLYPFLPKSDLRMLARHVRGETPPCPISYEKAKWLCQRVPRIVREMGASTEESVKSRLLLVKLKRLLETALERAFLMWSVSHLQISDTEPLLLDALDAALVRAIRLWNDGKAPAGKDMMAGFSEEDASTLAVACSDPVAVLSLYTQRRGKLLSEAQILAASKS